MTWNRREFLNRTTASLATLVLVDHRSGAGIARDDSMPKLRLVADPSRPIAPYLSWDTEDGDRIQTNLLRSHSGITIRLRIDGEWRQVVTLPTRSDKSGDGKQSYRINVHDCAEILWTIESRPDRLSFRISGNGDRLDVLREMELVFPFDPAVTPVTVIPSTWNEDETLTLPAIVSAPDFGQMLLSETTNRPLKCRLEGSRKEHTVDFVIEFKTLNREAPFELSLTPLRLPPPPGLKDKAIWPVARRPWFNAWQPSAHWGEQDRPYSSPAGILANNVISDPASVSIYFYSDMALWIPELAPGISVAPLVRRTVDWWLDKRTRPGGEVVGYWDFGNFLDANVGPVIGAWDYVESTGDKGWLERRIEQLEFAADFLSRRDVDGDGMVEATQSGNRNTLIQPNRSCCWFDALNCGHKDGYTNALIYRSWRCLADLEGKLGRSLQRSRYTQLADKLKTVYAKTLYNRETGLLGWWRSADGELHDYATPIVNGLAIEYGLVEPDEGRKILNRLWQKIQTVGFDRLELGLPCTLDPVHRDDYLLPDSIGCPREADGTDSFQHYMNGGITAGQVLHLLAADYVAGEPGRADRVLRLMLERAAKGRFQNGVRDEINQGVDWSDWKGRPTGYEGYLADVYYFLQAVVLRESSFRETYYRPLRSPENVA